jgi:hypothetical protein
VPANTLIQHFSNPWCLSHGGRNYLVMTLEEAIATVSQGIEDLLPDGIPAELLANFVSGLPREAAVARIRQVQKRRDREMAAEDLLMLLDERWVAGLVDRDGVDSWLARTAQVAFLGRKDRYVIYGDC